MKPALSNKSDCYHSYHKPQKWNKFFHNLFDTLPMQIKLSDTHPIFYWRYVSCFVICHVTNHMLEEDSTHVFSHVKIGNITWVKTWFFHVTFHVSFDVKFGYMGFCDFSTNNPQNSCLVTCLLAWNITIHNMELNVTWNLT